MVTTSYQSTTKDSRNRLSKVVMTIAVAILLGIGIMGKVSAASAPVSYTTTPFTPGEVSMWVPDRTSPTGGYGSVSFGGRGNVLEMNFNHNLASMVAFHQTEGLQKDIPDSDSIKADVYVDSAWTGKTVRAGLWGVGHDATDSISSYPIIEYSTDMTSGWRYWSVDHWVNLVGVTANQGAWNSLSITHDRLTHEFVYRVNGTQVATSPDESSTTIAAAILNSKNFGVADYSAHWSNFAYGNVVAAVSNKDDCKGDGWKTALAADGSSFKNQGACVSYVASNGKSQH